MPRCERKPRGALEVDDPMDENPYQSPAVRDEPLLSTQRRGHRRVQLRLLHNLVLGLLIAPIVVAILMALIVPLLWSLWLH